MLRLPSLEHPFDNDSSAIAYHARLILRGEPLYSTHHPGHHLPAAYYLYTLAFILFGDSLFAIKFLLMLWTIATVYLLYRLGAMIISRTAGVLAAIFYAILTSHLWMWGNSAEIELFANLPRIAAFLVLMNLTRLYPLSSQSAANWKFIFVGLLSAVAFLFKVVYLSPLTLAGFTLGLELWSNRTQMNVWRTTAIRCIWIGVGFGVTLLLVLSYFTSLGLLSRFLSVFTFGQGYTAVSVGGAQYALYYPILGLAYNNVALLIFCLAGLMMIVINKTYRATTLLPVALWLMLSFIEAGGLVRVFRFYYYLLTVPPLALLAAWFLLRIYHDLQQVRLSRRWLAPLAFAGLLTLTLAISIVQNFNFYAHYIRYRVGQETYREFLQSGSPFGPQLLQLQELAGYIQQRTSPTDRIYYWSEDVQLYYLADRRYPIDVIWTLYVNATGPRERIFAPTTKYVIVDTSRPDRDWTWLYPELTRHYRLETIIYQQEIYHRLSQNDLPNLSNNINLPIIATDVEQ
ncbi:MAG: hypothetical protein HYR94_20750 [Chloroflexi bacterium]|nr:hypothetical protein [Chloroflexota bacterium]